MQSWTISNSNNSTTRIVNSIPPCSDSNLINERLDRLPEKDNLMECKADVFIYIRYAVNSERWLSLVCQSSWILLDAQTKILRVIILATRGVVKIITSMLATIVWESSYPLGLWQVLRRQVELVHFDSTELFCLRHTHRYHRFKNT
jgi:hypothetical protein